MRIKAAGITLGVCLLTGPVLGQVVIDGSTATSVNIDPSGRVTVGVAPTSGADSVSHNRYDQFSVPRAGVDLDNRASRARTIVNEVTGTSQTEFNGPLEVLGQRAHVIVANPNGITVDGGSFINTGRAVLTTGAISTNAREIAPGIFQENVVATTNGGTINITGGGLAGQMDAVDLIAHRVRVGAPITNGHTDDRSGINIIAGGSRTEFDSSIEPGNLDRVWASTTSTGRSSDGEVLIEITRQGVLRANRIEMQVTDQGAGARVAGVHLATARQFILRADGQIDLSGANIAAATDATITGRSVVLNNTQARASEGVLRVEATDANGPGIEGFNAALSGRTVDLISASNVSFGADTLGGSRIVATADDINVDAAGDIADSNGLWEASRDVLFTSQGRQDLVMSTIDARRNFVLDAAGAITVHASQIEAQQDVLIAAQAASFTSSAERRSEVLAREGALVITTRAGDLVNEGALLQGQSKSDGTRDPAGTLSDGAITLNVAGDLINHTTEDHLAIFFANGGDLSIRTEGDIINAAARLLSNADVRIQAGGDLINAIELPGGSSDARITTYTRKGKRQWWTLWLKRKTEDFVEYDYGVIANTDQLSTITGAGDVTLEAQNILNRGGEINANGGDVTLTAVRIETEGVGSGRAYVRRVCVLTCRYEGSSDIAIFGGRINAANDITINATEAFRSKGGELTALGNVAITAPDVSFEAILVPTVVERPQGLYNFWRSKGAWVYLRDQFGGILADTGQISIKSDNPVRLLGVELEGDIPNGVEVVYGPRTITPVYDQRIGHPHDLPVVRQ